MRSTLILLSFLTIFSCKQAEDKSTADTDQLGELHESFQVNEAAKAHFETGLLLLHNFEYDDARAEFLKAQEADPEAVMTYWGEAMTYNHPLWRRQEFEDGAAALAKFGESPEERTAKTHSEIEADFLKAAEILFGPGEKDERDQAYRDHMAQMHETYPKNEEVSAFYALSILGAVPVGRDTEAYEAGAEVAKSVLLQNPQHPGALHYLIHSYDDPAHAHMALDAAANYSKVAADAVHALHMPSHIFLAVGMWEEVVSSNIASFDASMQKVKEQELSYDKLSYHALNWLQYGHLQLGQYDEAKQIMDDMLFYTDSIQTKHARGYCIAMKGAYLLETGDWQHPISDYDISTEELGITARAKVHFIDAVKAVKNKADAEDVTAIAAELEEDINKSRLLIDESGLPMCSSGSGSSYKINRLDIQQAEVVLYQIRALAAQLEEDQKLEEEWLKKAVELENQLSYGFGPPVILIPSGEMYGNFLLKHKRAEEAKTQFEKALERTPNRLLTKKGLEQAKMQDPKDI